MMGYGYGGWMHGGWGWGMGIGLLFWILLAAALVVIIRAAVRARANQGAGPATPHETPLEILQKRYARGDISRDEYEQKQRDLTGDQGPR